MDMVAFQTMTTLLEEDETLYAQVRTTFIEDGEDRQERADLISRVLLEIAKQEWDGEDE